MAAPVTPVRWLLLVLGVAVVQITSSLLMKWASYRAESRSREISWWKFCRSPFVSTTTYRRRSVKVEDPSRERRIAMGWGLAAATLYALALGVLIPLRPQNWVMGYVSLPMFVCFNFAWTSLAQVASSRDGRRPPPIMSNPLGSPGLIEFWGNRWNRYVVDWYLQILTPRFRNERARVLGVFLASGLWHEALFALPFYVVCRGVVFGKITGFFLVQAAGVLVDQYLRKRRRTRLRKIWLWAVLVAPMPLFLNDALLAMFYGGR
jgi:hypothetical protein